MSHDEERTPIEVPRPATVGESLIALATSTRVIETRLASVAGDLAEVKAAIPTLMTKDECSRQRKIDHPGIGHWLRGLVLVGAAASALGGVLGLAAKYVLEPFVARAERASVAAQLAPEPRERVVRETVAVGVPQPVPVPVDARVTSGPTKRAASKRGVR